MPSRPRSAPESLLPLRPADFQILLVLGAAPLHAYGISKAAEAQTQGGVLLEIGSLYRTLNRLVADGLIAETSEPLTGPQGQPRRTYCLTPFGRQVARAEAERLRQVVAVARARKFLAQDGS